MEQQIPFGRIEKGSIFRSAWGRNPEKKIGEVKAEDENSSVNYFITKYEDFAKKVDELEQTINTSENKGSYLMKLVHLQTLINDHDGLGDYEKLQVKLTALEKSLNEIIQQNRIRNSEIKKSLINEIKEAVKEINWKESTEAVHEIKSRWIKTGNPIEEEKEELETTFWGVIESFFERKRIFYEDKRRLQEKYRESYQALISAAEGVAELFGKAKYDKIDELKKAWRDVGNIAKEEYDPLLKEFTTKLKARPVKKNSPFNISDIVKELENMTNGQIKLDFKKLDGIKRSLKNFRPYDQPLRNLRNEALVQTQVLMEQDFIDKLARKRFKDFDKSDANKKKTIRIGVLRELINRDKSDLETFEENSSKFSSRTGNANDLIQRKLIQQKNKINVKERLMNILESK